MSLIEQYFGKNVVDVTYQDIEHFFSIEKTESDKIEFKSYVEGGNEKEKENGIIRSIAGFLNSGGGLIIWGSPKGEKVEGRSEKVFTGNLSAVTRRIEKDYFISRVTDSITPAPNNIFFHTLHNGERYIYIIEVLQSEYAPHQYGNNYLMRIDGQTKHAPHHYIEALFKKISFPRLHGYIVLNRFYTDGRHFFLELAALILNMSRLQNEHKIFYRLVAGKGAIFQRSVAGDAGGIYQLQGHELRAARPVDTLYYNQPYRVTDVLQIDPSELMRYNYELDLYFYFAGEKSPLLVSTYKLQLRADLLDVQDLNKLFTKIDENKYSYEISDTLEKTDAERIKDLTGR